jgi:hypothetical protein
MPTPPVRSAVEQGVPLAKLEMIMLPRKTRIVLCVGLLAMAGGMPCRSGTAKAAEPDLVNRISKALPSGWTVDISSLEGKCYVNITTAPMETQASIYGSSYPGIDKGRLGISTKILPCYAPEMLERIKAHNQPIQKKLKVLGAHKHSDRQRELRSEPIDVPMFYDKNYGFDVSYASRIPVRPEDAQTLMDVLQRATSGWKSYDVDKPRVLDELRRILTH